MVCCRPADSLAAISTQAVGKLLPCATQHGARCGAQFEERGREPGRREPHVMEKYALRKRSLPLRISVAAVRMGVAVAVGSAPERDPSLSALYSCMSSYFLPSPRLPRGLLSPTSSYSTTPALHFMRPSEALCPCHPLAGVCFSRRVLVTPRPEAPAAAVRSPVGFVWRAMRVPCVSPVSVRPPCVFPSSTAPSLSVSCPVRTGPVSVRFERSPD